MQILQTTFTLPKPQFPHTQLSSSNSISPLSLLPHLSTLSLHHRRPPTTLIRMGGGPRTYPGGVSKWEWKRMQAKKAKQLLKARLSRERQIYEMRKRAELKAAVSDLERPWEVVQKGAPKSSSSIFSVSADEQVKVLADRFQKPGGFDMWSENDGPQIFHTHENLPSARFFPKGVVHSVKPYGNCIDDGFNSSGNGKSSVGNSSSKGGIRKQKELRGCDAGSKSSVNSRAKGGIRKLQGDGIEKNLMNVRREEGNEEANSKPRNDKIKGYGRRRTNSKISYGEEVYDMSLQGDGSYGFSGSKKDDKLRR
ncbi:uncharacterized protein LOC110713438 [Chenopodium quinoa]|uniref:Uncharacterized protein n=1 Tax=Chenopodium quinoa TaxID=63459 RepID=A0A803MR06_CHEQI|nr:uncharacterized protein LOC110713438 [Chenopodium quinoa]